LLLDAHYFGAVFPSCFGKFNNINELNNAKHGTYFALERLKRVSTRLKCSKRIPLTRFGANNVGVDCTLAALVPTSKETNQA